MSQLVPRLLCQDQPGGRGPLHRQLPGQACSLPPFLVISLPHASASSSSFAAPGALAEQRCLSGTRPAGRTSSPPPLPTEWSSSHIDNTSPRTRSSASCARTGRPSARGDPKPRPGGPPWAPVCQPRVREERKKNNPFPNLTLTLCSLSPLLTAETFVPQPGRTHSASSPFTILDTDIRNIRPSPPGHPSKPPNEAEQQQQPPPQQQ